MSDPLPLGAPAKAPTTQPAEPTIVRFEGVGKAFRRFEVQPFLLRNLLLSVVGRAPAPKEFWPLRNVSFEIRRGETVGILGQNGAGKSTLLRLMAGACFPTEGKIQVRGRIAPLLSLGAGFQADMTGYECVEINATAFGLSHDEIDERMEAIIEFAELREFMSTPMRYYSSGMAARLGFAVAVNTSPDLLLCDEVLAVGDHLFQKKCMTRIEALREDGVTIVWVSHSAGQVQQLCDRVLWLRDGNLVADGAPATIVPEYLRV